MMDGIVAASLRLRDLEAECAQHRCDLAELSTGALRRDARIAELEKALELAIGMIKVGYSEAELNALKHVLAGSRS